jgi:hypothetical protein
MSENTQSNGVVEAPVVTSVEEVLAARAAQFAPKQTPESSEQEPNAGKSDEEASLTAEEASEEEDLDPVAKAKAHTAKGVQKRIDELTKQSKEYRDQADRAMRMNEELIARMRSSEQGQEQAKPESKDDGQPKPEDYADMASYVDAVTDWKMAKLEAKRAADAQRNRFEVAEQAARQKYPDYDDALRSFIDSDLKANPMILGFLAESEKATDVAYRLGKDAKLQKELANLSAFKLAAKLASIEESLSEASAEKSAEKPVSKAPVPPAKIAAGTPIVDPFTLEKADMSASDIQAVVDAVRKQYRDKGMRPPM